VKSVNQIAAGLLAASMASFLPLAHAAPTLVVNGGSPIEILTPPGFSYSAGAGGTTGDLAVTTTGFVFCANIGAGENMPVVLRPQRSRWTLPSGNDGLLAYSGGRLAINESAETSLACAVRDEAGKLRSPYSGHGDFLFTDSWEDAYSPARQLANLVNWIPVRDFSWLEPEWSMVPTDSCTWDNVENVARHGEDTLCAAATGVRPIAGGSQNHPDYGDRAPTMWTKTTSNNFIYLARIDTRFGQPSGTPNSHFQSVPRPAEGADTPSSVDVAIRDAYDSDYLMAAGTYCFLRKLPTVLDDNVCTGPDVQYSASLGGPSGLVNDRVPLSVSFNPAASLFVAVVRQKRTSGGSSPSSCQPNAAIAVIPDPAVARQFAGDEFIGDDVVFGFRNEDSFDWMGCIP